MKKHAANDIRTEYTAEDLGKGVRGKYYEAYKSGTNLVLLSPDLAEAFPTDEAVNSALRMLIQIAGNTGRKQRSAAHPKPESTSRSNEKA
jgi:hypothetical protein